MVHRGHVLRASFVAGAAAVLALSACQAIGGIESRSADPLSDTCKVPTDGAAHVRLANLVASDQKVDFCIRASGQSYKRPVLRGSGTDPNTICGSGLAYAQATVPVGVPAGSIDVKVIPAGQTCSAAPLVEQTGIQVGTDLVVTLAHMGGGGTPDVLAALPEASGAVAASTKIRFVGAVPNVAFDFGLTQGATKLPSGIDAMLFSKPVPFAGTVDPTVKPLYGTLDAHGYLTLPNNKVHLVAAPHGTNKGIFVYETVNTSNVTIWAIGDPSNGQYPLRGLYCTDSSTSSDGTLQDCKLTDLATIKVEMFNAGLYGAFAAAESTRAPAVIDFLSKRDADLLCISEIARHDGDSNPDQHLMTQDNLKTKAADAFAAKTGGFPYVAIANTNLDSQPYDPKDANGKVPPLPTAAPCAGVPSEDVDGAYSCLEAKCSDPPSSDAGVTAGGTDCYGQSCGTQLLRLLNGDDAAHRCVNCLFMNGLSYFPWVDGRTACLNDTRTNYAFHGTTPTMLLSKFELSNVETYVLPSTDFRRTVVKATVAPPGGQPIDVYCAQLSPQLGDLVPYVGNYGNGKTGAEAWAAEESLQAKKLVDLVAAKSGSKRAIIVGDWSASAQYVDPKTGAPVLDKDGKTQIADSNADAIKTLQSAFVEAVPSGYSPKCTRCPSNATGTPDQFGNQPNVFNGPELERTWSLRVYVNKAWGTNPAQAASIVGDDPNAVTLTADDQKKYGSGTGPLADSYGFRVELLQQ